MVMDEGSSSYYLEATVPLRSVNPLSMTAVLMKYDAENYPKNVIIYTPPVITLLALSTVHQMC